MTRAHRQPAFPFCHDRARSTQGPHRKLLSGSRVEPNWTGASHGDVANKRNAKNERASSGTSSAGRAGDPGTRGAHRRGVALGPPPEARDGDGGRRAARADRPPDRRTARERAHPPGGRPRTRQDARAEDSRRDHRRRALRPHPVHARHASRRTSSGRPFTGRRRAPSRPSAAPSSPTSSSPTRSTARRRRCRARCSKRCRSSK